MLNNCSFIGYVGKDPDCSVTQKGTEVAKFNIAVQRDFDKEKSDWINCVIFGATVTKFIKPFVHKGDLVFVQGALHYSSYKASDAVIKTTSSLQVDKIHILVSKSNTVPEYVNTNSDNATDGTEEGSLPF